MKRFTYEDEEIDNDQSTPLKQFSPLDQNKRVLTDQQSSQTFNIPEEVLYSSSGYIKTQSGWSKISNLVLTYKKCGDFVVQNMDKIKVYKKCQIPEHHVLKIEGQNKQRVWCLPVEACYTISYLCVWIKLNAMNFLVDNKEQYINCCSDEIYKKTQILKNWEPRYLLITQKDGLMSHKNQKQGPTLQIHETEELWTRFQTIQDQRYIVYKLWHSIIKQQFALPTSRGVKWWKAFYSLLRK